MNQQQTNKNMPFYARPLFKEEDEQLESVESSDLRDAFLARKQALALKYAEKPKTEKKHKTKEELALLRREMMKPKTKVALETQPNTQESLPSQ